ncbi:PREDICTED: uncharacterized protein LOC106812770 [Priapulus caudatus]|uniref:Uncharacterized protein LOC106812770 n=1 Tax=Priapulus caudatus TaxID=37621 RepID=A0ABM1EJ56_PRICU|nr:PREDICTED: uncharacterized protein LOC106812770 [Priapulus caudatus]
MCSYSFIRLLKEKDALVELLPCAAKHSHPMAVAEKVPVYYGDVVISKSQSEKIKKFDDLRGHTWAYNDSESLSGNIQVLKQLKSMGENASFFGHIVETGSHIKSLEMILNSTVDGACIDSNVLASYLMKNPSMKDKLHVIASLGPLPAYPVVINKNLPESLKVALRDALQRMHEDETGGPHLRRHGVSGFVPTDISLYDFETKIRQESSGLRIGTAYY